ncbi:mucin-5AC-like isoform X1 [Diaphorina citri]|uniref:Mucin-5AC-like isoform X1 n=1 Tax=Diaphorina citri TaxID=121845 RepID=A0A1S4EMF6_DIACI|nr:mucin-5AC-like isoform X1 [Diaphorina citri]
MTSRQLEEMMKKQNIPIGQSSYGSPGTGTAGHKVRNWGILSRQPPQTTSNRPQFGSTNSDLGSLTNDLTMTSRELEEMMKKQNIPIVSNITSRPSNTAATTGPFEELLSKFNPKTPSLPPASLLNANPSFNRDPLSNYNSSPNAGSRSNSFGPPSTNSFGRPSTNSFGPPSTNSFGPPSTNSFGTPSGSSDSKSDSGLTVDKLKQLFKEHESFPIKAKTSAPSTNSFGTPSGSSDSKSDSGLTVDKLKQLFKEHESFPIKAKTSAPSTNSFSPPSTNSFGTPSTNSFGTPSGSSDSKSDSGLTVDKLKQLFKEHESFPIKAKTSAPSTNSFSPPSTNSFGTPSTNSFGTPSGSSDSKSDSGLTVDSLKQLFKEHESFPIKAKTSAPPKGKPSFNRGSSNAGRRSNNKASGKKRKPTNDAPATPEAGRWVGDVFIPADIDAIDMPEILKMSAARHIAKKKLEKQQQTDTGRAIEREVSGPLQFKGNDPEIKRINRELLKRDGGYILDGDFYQKTNEARERALELHDEYRALHYGCEMAYDDRLDKVAQAYADHLAERVAKYGMQEMKHSTGTKLGENLFKTASDDHLIKDPVKVVEDAVDSWYSEISTYNDYGNPDTINTDTSRFCIGHFTQLVWRDSRYLGFGISRYVYNGTAVYIVVCNYDPAGNVVGLYASNVLKEGDWDDEGPPEVFCPRRTVYPHANDTQPPETYFHDDDGNIIDLEGNVYVDTARYYLQRRANGQA